MKLSAEDLLLVNVDKLFTVASVIGLLDLPFKHVVLFSHIVTPLSGPNLLSDANYCKKLCVFTQWHCRLE